MPVLGTFMVYSVLLQNIPAAVDGKKGSGLRRRTRV